jgi:hypothetical protein
VPRDARPFRTSTADVGVTPLRHDDRTLRRRRERVGAYRRQKLSYYWSRVVDMPRGRPSPKLAITVDPVVHAGIVAAAEADGVSVSAWMTEAARRALVVRNGLAGVAEWEARHGRLTPEELDAARDRLERRARRGRRSA